MVAYATAAVMWPLWRKGVESTVSAPGVSLWYSSRVVGGAGASTKSNLSLGNSYKFVPAADSFVSSLRDIQSTTNAGFNCVTPIPIDLSLVDLPSLSGDEIHVLNCFHSDVMLAVEDYISGESFLSEADKDSFIAWIQKKTSAVSTVGGHNSVPINTSLYL